MGYIDNSQIEGLGTAGTPVGGVLTVQGTAGGRPVIATDIISTAGQYRAQSITTTAALALGGSSALANRKFISVSPTNGVIYWGFDASVTTTTGTPVMKNQMITFAFSVPIYLISAGTVDARIAEGS